MAKDTGGAAFPFMFTITKGSNDLTGAIAQVEQRHVMTGMTLRDYFAAKAMQGAMTNFNVFDAITKVGREDGVERVEAIALFAYDLADAMLAERVK